MYAGAVCYADDLTLLAPSPSALRLMLKCCDDFTTSHGLMFNYSKTQLLRFGLPKHTNVYPHPHLPPFPSLSLQKIGLCIPVKDSVVHVNIMQQAAALRGLSVLIQGAYVPLHYYSGLQHCSKLAHHPYMAITLFIAMNNGSSGWLSEPRWYMI